ncbi:MAG: hydrogenase maturation protease [Planctomycetaceae bacterium]|nr:hydrogenase maturation protease [Planctomycetaceae bacterium]
MSDPQKILLIGFGNPGRLDDGLGPALAQAIEEMALPNVTVDIDYQVSVEHAQAIAGCDRVVFADASTDCPEPFSFTRIEPAEHLSFSSHSLSPAAAMSLAGELFAAKAEGYILAVRGYDFNEFGERLSAAAMDNLAAATAFARTLLSGGDWAQVRPWRCEEPASSATAVNRI